MSKYRNKPTTIDGIRFSSKAEAARYCELKLMQRAGEIFDLELQPRYKLIVSGRLVTTYVADFYFLDQAGTPHTEDVKGFETQVFKIKAKLFRALMGREVELIR